MKKGVKVLGLLLLGLFMINFVSALEPVSWAQINGPGDFFKWVAGSVITSVSPVGYESGTGVLLGIIAMIMILVIMIDIFQLVLPFSDWVTYVLAAGFTIAGLTLGVVRTIAGWGLALGATITGAAGTLAIIMSAVLFLVAIIFLFFGGQALQKWLGGVKGRRLILQGEAQAYKTAAKLAAGKRVLAEAGKSI